MPEPHEIDVEAQMNATGLQFTPVESRVDPYYYDRHTDMPTPPVAPPMYILNAPKDYSKDIAEALAVIAKELTAIRLAMRRR